MKLFKFLILLVVCLPFSVSILDADTPPHKQEIPLDRVVGSKENDNRSIIKLPVVCYYYGVTNVIVTNVSPNLGDVTLTVTNTSTGEVWYDVFDSGTDPQTVLPISGTDGLYEIVYTTECGDVYEGTLVLN